MAHLLRGREIAQLRPETVKYLQISGGASVALSGDESDATRFAFRGRWFMCSASTRRADITAPLGDGMSLLDASQASVSDPFVSLYSFLDSRPPPVVLVLASVARVVYLVVQGQLGMCGRSKLPVRELAGLLGNGLWDHIWPAVTTLDQVFRQCSQGVTMPSILQTLTLATCLVCCRGLSRYVRQELGVYHAAISEPTARSGNTFSPKEPSRSRCQTLC